MNSPVEGVTFATATQSGVTNATGQFQYKAGEMVTFSVGGIDLGTVTAAPILTPVELTGSPSPGTAAVPNAATNMLVFLQSIDADQNYLTGITISNATRAAAQGQALDFNSPTFAADVVTVVAAIAPGNTVVTYTEALDNFYETYKSLGGSNTFSWPFPGYPPFPGGGTVNLLTNGGFESPDASAGDVYCSTGWQCFNDGNFTNNTAGPAFGPVSHDVPGTQSFKQFGVDAGVFQTVPAVPGSPYVASVWAMNWVGDPLNNLGIVQLTFWDGPNGTGNQIGAAFEAFVDPTDDNVNIYLPVEDGADVTDWTEVTVSATAPAGTVSAKLLLLHVLTPPAPGGGTVRWDDASLTGPAPAPSTLLANGGFESPDASAGDVYCSTGWQCFNAGNFTNNTAGPAFGPVSHDVPGTQSFKQFGVDAGVFQTVPAVPGSPYVASVWAMNWVGDPLNNLGIVQLTFWDGPNGTGNQIGAAFEAFVDPTDDNVNIYLPVEDGADVTDWTEITVSATAPAGTVSAKLLLLHVLTPPAPGGGTVRWDDASLTGPAGSPPANLTLVWSDEFNSGTSPDPNNWTLETGYGPNSFGWGNDEWQLYTTDPNNIRIVYQDPTDPSNGYLNISALLDTVQCPSPAPPPGCGKRDGSITSARIITLPTQPGQGLGFRYGRIEASIKLPVGIGTWPAFWMLGENFPIVGWPSTGEIDILELFDSGGTSNQEAHFTLHWCDESLLVGCAFPNGYATISSFRDLGVSLGNDFHVYAAEWNASGVVWKVDGVTYYSTPIQPATMEEFLENFFVILNVAIGGFPVPDPDATGWPRTMLVDWVRVYQ